MRMQRLSFVSLSSATGFFSCTYFVFSLLDFVPLEAAPCMHEQTHQLAEKQIVYVYADSLCPHGARLDFSFSSLA